MNMLIWVIFWIMVACLALMAFAVWLGGSENRDRCRFARERFNRRPKAPIIKVGTISRGPDGRVILDNWVFEYSLQIPMFYVIADDKNVHTVMLGYTDEELLYIADHPDEFEGVET